MPGQWSHTNVAKGSEKLRFEKKCCERGNDTPMGGHSRWGRDKEGRGKSRGMDRRHRWGMTTKPWGGVVTEGLRGRRPCGDGGAGPAAGGSSDHARNAMEEKKGGGEGTGGFASVEQ